jgi:hypothetical protein
MFDESCKSSFGIDLDILKGIDLSRGFDCGHVHRFDV